MSPTSSSSRGFLRLSRYKKVVCSEWPSLRMVGRVEISLGGLVWVQKSEMEVYQEWNFHMVCLLS